MKKLLILAVLLLSCPIAAFAEGETSPDEPIEAIIIDDETGDKNVIITEDKTPPKEIIVTEDQTEEITTDTPPMRPLNLKIINVTTDTISIVWNDNMGYDQVESYNIYVNGSKVGSSELSEYVIEDLMPGRNYEITITAINFYGESFESDPITVNTLKEQGMAPKNIKIMNVTESSALISWDGEGLYNIYVDGDFFDSITNNYYMLENLEENTIYEVTVESYLDGTLYSTITLNTGEAIQQDDINEIINTGFEYISAMWPYMAVIAGLVITFAIASMMLGIFDNFRIG